MFDIGFWELVLVGLIALLVFGPERLPRVARETALWIKKARAVVTSVKEEIDHELQLQDLKQSLAKQKRLLEQPLKLPGEHESTSKTQQNPDEQV